MINDTSISILLVEDNPGDADLLREILAEARVTQFKLAQVEQVSEALERLTAERFDIILLDLSLPDSQGLEALAKLRVEAPEMPVVILTGLAAEALGLQALQLGAQDYLVKGQVNTQLLVRSLRYAIERNRLQAELHNLSLKDDLTGLYNRRGFLALAEHELKSLHRAKGLLLIFADLDGLKEINDTFGHQAGNLALVKTAEILRDSFRHSDTIARLGGDEFAIFSIGATGQAAEIMATRLQEKLKSYNAQKNHPYPLSLSTGMVACGPESMLSITELMAQADAAMYEHKQSKRKSERGLPEMAYAQPGAVIKAVP